MRYDIINGQPKSSIFINAPYDSKQDALDDIKIGIKHACQYCILDVCPTLGGFDYNSYINLKKS